MRSICLAFLCLVIMFEVSEGFSYGFWMNGDCSGFTLSSITFDTNQCFALGNNRWAKAKQTNSTHIAFSQGCSTATCDKDCKVTEVKSGVCVSQSGLSYKLSSPVDVVTPQPKANTNNPVAASESFKYGFWMNGDCSGTTLTSLSFNANQCFALGNNRWAKATQTNSTHIAFSQGCSTATCDKDCLVTEVKSGVCVSQSGLSYKLSSPVDIVTPQPAVENFKYGFWMNGDCSGAGFTSVSFDTNQCFELGYKRWAKATQTNSTHIAFSQGCSTATCDKDCIVTEVKSGVCVSQSVLSYKLSSPVDVVTPQPKANTNNTAAASESFEYGLWANSDCSETASFKTSFKTNQCFALGTNRWAKVTQTNSTHIAFSQGCSTATCDKDCIVTEFKSGVCVSQSGLSYKYSSPVNIVTPQPVVEGFSYGFWLNGDCTGTALTTTTYDANQCFTLGKDRWAKVTQTNSTHIAFSQGCSTATCDKDCQVVQVRSSLCVSQSGLSYKFSSLADVVSTQPKANKIVRKNERRNKRVGGKKD